MVKEALLVGAGGFAGSIARYLISAVMIGSQTSHFIPWGTFTVNAVGSLLIGILLSVFSPAGTLYFLCIAGFCGGFTTFSAFSADLLAMLRAAQYLQSAVYIAASVAICLLAVWAGFHLGEKFIK